MKQIELENVSALVNARDETGNVDIRGEYGGRRYHIWLTHEFQRLPGKCDVLFLMPTAEMEARRKYRSPKYCDPNAAKNAPIVAALVAAAPDAVAKARVIANAEEDARKAKALAEYKERRYEKANEVAALLIGWGDHETAKAVALAVTIAKEKNL